MLRASRAERPRARPRRVLRGRRRRGPAGGDRRQPRLRRRGARDRRGDDRARRRRGPRHPAGRRPQAGRRRHRRRPAARARRGREARDRAAAPDVRRRQELREPHRRRPARSASSSATRSSASRWTSTTPGGTRTSSREIDLAGEQGTLFGFHVCDWRVDTRHLLTDRGLMGDGCIDMRNHPRLGRRRRLPRVQRGRGVLGGVLGRRPARATSKDLPRLPAAHLTDFHTRFYSLALVRRARVVKRQLCGADILVASDASVERVRDCSSRGSQECLPHAGRNARPPMRMKLPPPRWRRPRRVGRRGRVGIRESGVGLPAGISSVREPSVHHPRPHAHGRMRRRRASAQLPPERSGRSPLARHRLHWVRLPPMASGTV